LSASSTVSLGQRTDFFSHWLVETGFTSLGASYPFDNPDYPSIYLDFTITDRGRQVAKAAPRAVLGAHRRQ